MTVRELIGSWELLSFELEDPAGIRKPWGTDIRGILIYSETGKMSVAINKKIESSPDGEAQDTLDSMLFYSGRYSIEDSTVHHHVEVASDPERVGKDLVRSAELTGDALKLTSPAQSFGRSILVWKKVRS